MPIKDKDKRKEYNRQWFKDHPGYKKEYKKKWSKRQNLKLKYNLLYEDWLKIWETQEGKCKICGKPFKNPSKAFVDHNHETNKIRGLLCVKCNFGIGYFDDNPILTTEATKYLLGDK